MFAHNLTVVLPVNVQGDLKRKNKAEKSRPPLRRKRDKSPLEAGGCVKACWLKASAAALLCSSPQARNAKGYRDLEDQGGLGVEAPRPATPRHACHR